MRKSILYMVAIITIIAFLLVGCGTSGSNGSQDEDGQSVDLAAETSGEFAAPVKDEVQSGTQHGTEDASQHGTNDEMQNRGQDSPQNGTQHGASNGKQNETSNGAPITTENETQNRVQDTPQDVEPAPSVNATPPKAAEPPTTSHTPSTGSATPAPAEEPAKNTVTIAIRGDGDIGSILEPINLDWEEDDTVLSVLKRITRAKKIAMEYTGKGTFAYVEGINNIYEFDHGPYSGWVFYLNGKSGIKSPGIQKVNPGDRIDWIYVLEESEMDVSGDKA